MPKKPAKLRTRSHSSRPAAKIEKGGDERDAAAERAFIESLIATGQAAVPDATGKLPAGATHEIVAPEGDDGPKVVRKRASIY